MSAINASAKTRVRSMERQLSRLRPQGTVLVIHQHGQYSRDGRHYTSLAALRDGENQQTAKLFVFSLEPSSWRPN